MKNTPLKVLVASAALFAAGSAAAYNNVDMFNAAHYPATITVNYSGCKSDTFTVAAATANGPGRATAGSSRGACLLTTISATLNGAGYKIADYSSSGTSLSKFVIRYMGKDSYKIYSDMELQNIFDREAQNPNSPEGGFKTPATRNPLNAPLGSPAQKTIAECRAANVNLDKEIDAIYQKANGERKISPVEAKRYQVLESGIRDRRAKLAKDGFTLDDCHAMTKLYDAEKAEVIKMGQ